jgi:hypothetical protein
MKNKNTALGLHTPAHGPPVAPSADDWNMGQSFAECLDAKMRREVAGSGALLRRCLDLNSNALKSAAAMDFRFLWQEFFGSAAQGYGQRGSSSWTKRTEAIHG